MSRETRSGAGRGTPVRPGRERARELLGAGNPREVLSRIVPDDPLELRALVGARLSERALLLDAERVLLVAQALCALESSRRREHELEAWLLERIEEALVIALTEDAAPAGLDPFAAPLALDSPGLAAACKTFNALPFEQREAFFALVLDASGADRAARARGLSLSVLARRARAALELFLPSAALAALERTKASAS